MPTYEYHCIKCGQNFEAVQSMKDPHFEVCPKALCRMETWGEGPVKRQMGTGAGLIFKGSGFYITDYRSENYKEGAKKESGAGAAATGGEKTGGAETSKPKSEPAAAPAAKPETPKPASPPPKSDS
jgi:putative FmdB family regulatory protein